jgi:branched-subunit amino acid aminotransferase/4-amino-4-deoxychorismate lyase
MHYVMMNSQMVAAADALVSVTDRGFRFGDGVFETIAVHHGRPWQFGWHMGRLARGLAAVKIRCDVEKIENDCRKLLAKNAPKEAILRIQVTRGIGGRGYLPDENMAPTIIIETLPMPVIAETPVALWLSSYRKIPLQALPVQYKIAQGLNSTLTRIEAQENHCADGLQLNSSGDICETSSGNIFWLKNGILYTPALECGVLEGAVRAALIRLAPYPVREMRATLSDLETAEGVCITNTIWKALAVNNLRPQGWVWDSAGLAATLKSALMGDVGATAESA